ncbi:unnamed protein product [Prunus armeniaca]
MPFGLSLFRFIVAGRRESNVGCGEEEAGVAGPSEKENQFVEAEDEAASSDRGGVDPEVTPANRRREKRATEAELIREAHLQATGKRVIEGALDVTPLPKRPRGLNEEAAVVVPDDDEDVEAEPVNIACPRKVVSFVNCFIEGTQMELPELEQLLMKSLREQTGRAFHLQAAANMEMWLGIKQAVNTAERDADRHADENAVKIAKLSSRLAEAKRAAVGVEEARAAAEAAKEAELRSRAREVEEAKK